MEMKTWKKRKRIEIISFDGLHILLLLKTKRKKLILNEYYKLQLEQENGSLCPMLTFKQNVMHMYIIINNNTEL